MKAGPTKGSKVHPQELPSVYENVVSTPGIDRMTTYLVLTIPVDPMNLVQRELHCCLECESHDDAYQVVVQNAMLAGTFDPNTTRMTCLVYGLCREAGCLCGGRHHTIRYETGSQVAYTA